MSGHSTNLGRTKKFKIAILAIPNSQPLPITGQILIYTIFFKLFFSTFICHMIINLSCFKFGYFDFLLNEAIIVIFF